MQFIAEYLNRMKNEDLYRATQVYRPIDATHVTAGNETCLVLAANNYLGLTHHPAVQQAAAAAVLAYGTGSGGARLITGTHPEYALLEQELAEFKGCEAAVVFSTGYMANVGTISALAGKDDVIFSDELNHASIIDGCRLSGAKVMIYKHADTCHLASLLHHTNCSGTKIIVTDGVFSMDGDIAPLPDIVHLAQQFNTLVVVDDAHATGVIGPGGRGTAAYFGLEKEVHVQVGTLSKALAAEGGFAAGSRLLIEYLINRARSFIFTTALSAATIAAARAALKELKAKPELVEVLRDNAEFFRAKLTEFGLSIIPGETPIIPVHVGSAEKAVQLSAALLEQNLIISAIRPPTVADGSSRLRIAISAAHTKAELSAAAETIALSASKLNLIKTKR